MKSGTAKSSKGSRLQSSTIWLLERLTSRKLGKEKRDQLQRLCGGK